MLVVGMLSIGFIALASSRPILFIICIIVYINVAVNSAFHAIANGVIDSSMWEQLFSEVGQLGNAVDEYAMLATVSCLLSAGVIVALLAARRIGRCPLQAQFSLLTSGWGTVVALIPFVALVGALYRWDPDPIPWESNFTVGLARQLVRTIPTPGAVNIQPQESGIEKIVLVVDESVRADTFRDYFGPFMTAAGAVELKDAWTAVPCSGGSNAFLRWGINPEKKYSMEDDPRTQPTIFGYAARAGYERYLVDAQSTGRLQNHMSIGERALLTELIPSFHGIESDKMAAQTVNGLLRKPGKQLIYVVKRGSHFPYEMNLPPELRSRSGNKVENYDHAVEYSNEGFFTSLLDRVDRKNLLLIYTSDHGQNLIDGRLGHCNPEPLREELLVPLWIFSSSEFGHFSDTEKSQNEPTQFSTLQIPPTLLVAMGYRESDIVSEYYYPLWSGHGRRWLLRSPYLPYPATKAGPIGFREFADSSS